jgi:hypothetical protein
LSHVLRCEDHATGVRSSTGLLAALLDAPMTMGVCPLRMKENECAFIGPNGPGPRWVQVRPQMRPDAWPGIPLPCCHMSFKTLPYVFQNLLCTRAALSLTHTHTHTHTHTPLPSIHSYGTCTYFGHPHLHHGRLDGCECRVCISLLACKHRLLLRGLAAQSIHRRFSL